VKFFENDVPKIFRSPAVYLELFL